jgi:hypothetical protein
MNLKIENIMNRFTITSCCLASLIYTGPASAHIDAVQHIHQEYASGIAVLLLVGVLVAGIYAFRYIKRSV